MTSTWTRLVGIAAFVALALSISTVASSQISGPTFEYLRLTPGLPARPDRTFPDGYQACVAQRTDWACRSFESSAGHTDALPSALATLGAEGWELVASVDESTARSYPVGLTYFFKRQAR